MKSHDVLIVGGGPGASTLGALLARQGVDVGLVEKETFPRFKIGESLLPCSMDVFRESGVFDKLDAGKYIRKFGAKFICHKRNEQIYFDFSDNGSFSKSMAFEVERAEFDSDLLEHASECGVTVYQPETVTEMRFGEGFAEVITDRQTFRARYVADASGRAALLGNKMHMRQANTDLNNVAVFAHFQGVKREPGRREGDIIIGLLPNHAWSWTIPFKGNKTSVGVVTNAKFVDKERVLEDYIEKSIRCSPLFEELMEKAERVTDVMVLSNWSHTCERFFGDRWIAVGDAAAFLDPIFSSGVHVSVSSALMVSRVLSRALKSDASLSEPALGPAYEKDLRRGVKRFHNLIRLFYDTDFVGDMQTILQRPHTRRAFTAAVAGDVWDEDNVAFKMGAL